MLEKGLLVKLAKLQTESLRLWEKIYNLPRGTDVYVYIHEAMMSASNAVQSLQHAIQKGRRE